MENPLISKSFRDQGVFLHLLVVIAKPVRTLVVAILLFATIYTCFRRPRRRQMKYYLIMCCENHFSYIFHFLIYYVIITKKLQKERFL